MKILGVELDTWLSIGGVAFLVSSGALSTWLARRQKHTEKQQSKILKQLQPPGDGEPDAWQKLNVIWAYQRSQSELLKTLVQNQGELSRRMSGVDDRVADLGRRMTSADDQRSDMVSRLGSIEKHLNGAPTDPREGS
jgi:hypothetical protein